MDLATFWATKSPLPVYETVTFTHAAFTAPFRLVSNVFEFVTLDGNVFTPAAMSIKPPGNSQDAQPKLTVSFPRQVVGRTFKQQLALIVASGSLDPIEVRFAVYHGVTSAPQIVWDLFASDSGGINFSADSVSVTATLDNPMRRSAALLYLPETFTGLQQL